MKRIHRPVRTALLALLTVTLAAALLPTASVAPAATASGALTLTAAGSAAATDRWTLDLSVVDGDDVNVRSTPAGLRLRDATAGTARAALGPLGTPAEGMLVGTPRTLPRPATRVHADVTARVPAGGAVEVEVRGWRTSGGWTEWRTGTAVFDRPVTRVQARVVLTARDPRAVATVRAVRLTADSAATGPRAAAAAATPGITYRVFATRIGLVGEVTANGRTIQPRDHFVALPSRRALAPDDTGDYTVRVCTTNGSRCTYAPVWDVGPWNTRDDYWNPSAVRENWKDLPRGRPEAQAAYQNGYHGGRDQFGRVVRNPAGIDLADGTFWDGLRLTTNAWVDVAYLWTGSGPHGVVGDGPLNIRAGASTAYASVGLAAQYAIVPIQCYATGQTVAGPYRTTNRWNRLATGQFVSHAYISAVYGGTVPRC
ncbi:hypothetical protein [Micromonospora globbae]|uniref:hypothetical protein n=1 Tax=Micromonospora globbae TaxID=1894969 RepID=UPI0034185C2D